MVGLGEQDDEVIEVMRDLRDNDVDMITIGQYPVVTFAKTSRKIAKCKCEMY